jgi:hypothetical protein
MLSLYVWAGGLAKKPRTGWPPSSSSYSDNGFHFEQCVFWRHKTVRPWNRWWFEDGGHIRAKIIHYRQVYLNRRHTIAFMPVTVDTWDHIYDDFIRLSVFLHSHREVSVLTNDLQEESGQFRFLRVACLTNLKGSVALILAKASAMRISIPLDLSSRSFIPLPCFIPSRSHTGTTFNPLPRPFPSVFCLSGTCLVFL